ncbi:hypothetical protein KKB68_01340 [Patescibacteria group bacterium]|nr:hypothetical protein [Patescibacteria group bacterium]
MNKKNKTISAPIVISVIILIAVLAGGIAVWQRQLLGERDTQELETEKPENDDSKENESGKGIEALIPEGWMIIAKAKGDLNEDDLTDVAIVIEEETESLSLEGAPSRTLLIILQKDNGAHELSAQSDKAILMASEGGVFGDPFEGILIDKGSLLIRFYGGSNWRWERVYKFRYQDNSWYLIGAVLSNYFTPTGEGAIEDYNLLTGKIKKISGKIAMEADESDETTEEWIDRGRKELLNLKDFNIRSSEEDF